MPTCVTWCRKPTLAGGLVLMISGDLFQPLYFCDSVILWCLNILGNEAARWMISCVYKIHCVPQEKKMLFSISVKSYCMETFSKLIISISVQKNWNTGLLSLSISGLNRCCGYFQLHPWLSESWRCRCLAKAHPSLALQWAKGSISVLIRLHWVTWREVVPQLHAFISCSMWSKGMFSKLHRYL